MFFRKTDPGYSNSTGVIVSPGMAANSLGVVRGFGRRAIPVVYLDSEWDAIVRYSRYIYRRLKCPNPRESEAEFISALLDFGKQLDGKMVIIPTGDRQVLALSKYKKELEQFYLLPLTSYETVHKLVNKRSFYKLLAKMQLPHPKTYFPADIAELQLREREINYPYIIKPAYSVPFQEVFSKKCFVINSSQELDWAVGRLREKNLEFMIQEIIPGKVVYEFYTYFNKSSEPLAICGWDKIRQYPPDFGSGSFCRSVWWPSAIELGLSLLKAISYRGIAGVELKKDPRDGRYKIIEVNARTVTQNRLASACGADIEYIAYLDVTGQFIGDLAAPLDNVWWVDDFADLLSCLTYLKRKQITVWEIVKSMRAKKLHSVAVWDDPVPFIAQGIVISFYALYPLFRKPIRALRSLLGKRQRADVPT